MLYYRRKVLLALLEVFGGQLTAKQIQKYLFIFTRDQKYNKVFDFVPYKYGCFSFQANYDIGVLAKMGQLMITEREDGRYIKLNSEEHFVQSLDLFDQAILRNEKQVFGNMSQTELITYTYKKYPYYAINSVIATQILTKEELDLVAQQRRVFSDSMLFSIGYEGLSLETYMNKLIINGVRVLCDVRKNAYSQKYGFSRKQLEAACNGVDIRYVHIPELGIESNQRQELKIQSDYDALFERYEQTTLKSNYEALLLINELLNAEKRVALTCFEKDPKQCHRTRVVNALMTLPNVKYQFHLL